MGLEGSCSDESIEHDHVASWQHARDKRAQEKRKGGDWIKIPSGGEFAFENDFSAFSKEEALYFILGGIPEVRAEKLKPEAWDESGTMASYSAGSQIAAYREFKRAQGRERQGRKVNGKAEYGPPAPPLEPATPHDELNLVPTDPKTYKALLRMVRDETPVFNCWGKGAGGRGQWKKVPIATKVELVEGTLPAELLDRDDELGGSEPNEKVRKLKTGYEMARMTVNSHPALARALAKLVKEGKKDEVRELMMNSVTRIVRAFETVTGRKIVGISIHWDSDLPHWNLWHTGLEKVIYKKGKGKDRARYRRTAMNLCSSGPGLRAWRRSQMALERMGRPTCLPTMVDLQKVEKKAMEDQGRLPGDWTINDAADAVLEELLVESGYKDVVDEGFTEFVANEERRYAAGVTGKVSRMDKETLAAKIQSLKGIADQRGVELETLKATVKHREIELDELKAAAPADGAIRKLVTEFLQMLADRPQVVTILRKVPVLRDLFQTLALLLKIDLFQLPEMPMEMSEEMIQSLTLISSKPSIKKSTGGVELNTTTRKVFAVDQDQKEASKNPPQIGM